MENKSKDYGKGKVIIECLDDAEWQRRQSIPYYGMSGVGGTDENGRYIETSKMSDDGVLVTARYYENGDLSVESLGGGGGGGKF